MSPGRVLNVVVAVGVGVACAIGVGGGGHDGAAPPVTSVRVDAGGLLPNVATGTVVGAGRVVTVAHVLRGGPGVVRAITVAGRRARVLRVDRQTDLALLGVAGVRAPAVRLATATATAAVELRLLRRGREVTHGVRVRRRVTARVREFPGDSPLVRPSLDIAAAVLPGDSGSPILDPRGNVLGIVFARANAGRPTTWAVESSAVRALLG